MLVFFYQPKLNKTRVSCHATDNRRHRVKFKRAQRVNTTPKIDKEMERPREKDPERLRREREDRRKTHGKRRNIIPDINLIRSGGFETKAEVMLKMSSLSKVHSSAT